MGRVVPSSVVLAVPWIAMAPRSVTQELSKVKSVGLTEGWDWAESIQRRLSDGMLMALMPVRSISKDSKLGKMMRPLEPGASTFHVAMASWSVGVSTLPTTAVKLKVGAVKVARVGVRSCGAPAIPAGEA